MPKILLHSCCAPCSTHVIQELQKEYEVTVFYFNPNIFPEAEYKKRLKELENYLGKIKVNLIIGKYDHQQWLKIINGLELEPEGGERCFVCYKYRLEETARKAREMGFDIFCSTLSISPHKNAEKINEFGKELAKKYKIGYLESNWKKKNGFQISCQISREEGFYRQEYCGCEFSIRH